MKIGELKADTKKVGVEGTITSKGDVQTLNLNSGGTNQKVDAQLSDDSGSILLVLWGAEAVKFDVGDRVKVENGYTTSYKGVTQLSVGKFGKISKVGDKPELSTEANEKIAATGNIRLVNLEQRIKALEEILLGSG